MKFAFAGDRLVATKILNLLMDRGHKPLALMVSDGKNATHSEELIEHSGLDVEFILKGKAFETQDAKARLKALDLDYIIGVHFPYIIPEEVIQIPKLGFLNLHPSYLPFNKGWHTPSWAILEGTPYGATLHFMSPVLDEGDVIHQKQLNVLPNDTANSLYARVLELELEVFMESLPLLESLSPARNKQFGQGTSHKRKDLKALQSLELDEMVRCGTLLDKLRALTTNKKEEAAYFMHNGKKYSVQIKIEEIE